MRLLSTIRTRKSSTGGALPFACWQRTSIERCPGTRVGPHPTINRGDGKVVPAPPLRGQTPGWQDLSRRSASRPIRIILHFSVPRLSPIQPPLQQTRAADEREPAEGHPGESDDGAGSEPERGGHACRLRRSRARLADAPRDGSAFLLPLFISWLNSACISVRRGLPFLGPSHRHPE